MLQLVYQQSCNPLADSLFVGFYMLREIGENVNEHLRYLAFHTCKRLVRWRLLKHLQHMNRLSEEELELIHQIDLLERLYANPCYAVEFNRMTTSLARAQYPEFPQPFVGRTFFNLGMY